MKRFATGLCLTAMAIATLALPAMAGAEYLVPPGNSAATQYTETVPTAGGNRDAEKDRRRGNRSPTTVLGADNARRLDKQGSAGHEVAEFAAETAPEETVGEALAPSGESSDQRGDGDPGPEQERKPADGDDARATDANGSAGTGSGGSSPPSGSSGLLEVIDQATGASSVGQIGVLLPLAILATLAWALAFLLRQRNRPTT